VLRIAASKAKRRMTETDNLGSGTSGIGIALSARSWFSGPPRGRDACVQREDKQP